MVRAGLLSPVGEFSFRCSRGDDRDAADEFFDAAEVEPKLAQIAGRGGDLDVCFELFGRKAYPATAMACLDASGIAEPGCPLRGFRS